jgi:hypothetical protein
MNDIRKIQTWANARDVMTILEHPIGVPHSIKVLASYPTEILLEIRIDEKSVCALRRKLECPSKIVELELASPDRVLASDLRAAQEWQTWKRADAAETPWTSSKPANDRRRLAKSLAIAASVCVVIVGFRSHHVNYSNYSHPLFRAEFNLLAPPQIFDRGDDA